MNHIVNMCPAMKFDGGVMRLHEADDDDDAANWLNDMATTAFVKWNEINVIYNCKLVNHLGMLPANQVNSAWSSLCG